ncbi:MAG: thioesterase family protein [Pseudomonadota bacterium]|nr:thioesterase family protein [Pseudomonadota bacterium]
MFPTDGIIKTVFTIPDKLDLKTKSGRIIYYSIAFEEGIEDYKNVIGLSPEYVERYQKSTVALEAHTTYFKRIEFKSVVIATRIHDFDGKKAHIYQELFSSSTLLATQETLSISFNLRSRRTCPFDISIARRYEELFTAQKDSKKSEFVGISLSRLAR